MKASSSAKGSDIANGSLVAENRRFLVELVAAVDPLHGAHPPTAASDGGHAVLLEGLGDRRPRSAGVALANDTVDHLLRGAAWWA
jgi:hypothetical protein